MGLMYKPFLFLKRVLMYLNQWNRTPRTNSSEIVSVFVSNYLSTQTVTPEPSSVHVSCSFVLETPFKIETERNKRHGQSVKTTLLSGNQGTGRLYISLYGSGTTSTNPRRSVTTEVCTHKTTFPVLLNNMSGFFGTVSPRLNTSFSWSRVPYSIQL